MRTLVEEFFNGDLDAAISKLPSRAERTADYEAAMNDLLDPRSAPQPGGPWVVGGWNDMTLTERIDAMTEAKQGGAYADAVAMQARGYAIGEF